VCYLWDSLWEILYQAFCAFGRLTGLFNCKTGENNTMGSITDFLENELLDHVCNAGYTPAANLYVALSTASPGEAATGASLSEVANSGNYQRAAITFATAASRAVDQTGAVTFNQATAGWGTVTDWAICTSQTYGAGDVLAYGSFAASKVIANGNTPSIATSEIDVTYSAGEISNFLSLELLDHAFRNASYASPATWIALCTSVVVDGDTGSTITEPGANYARVQVNINGGGSPTWDLAASGLVDNTHAIAFTTATASWGSVVAVAICDASTAGNLLFYDNTMADQAVGNGDTASFPIGDLDITMT
jgi:hypothetical protein